MKAETALCWWSLGVLTKRRYDALLGLYGNLDDPLAGLSIEMLRELKVKQEYIVQTWERFQAFDADRCHIQMKERGVQLLTIEDAHYPVLLKEIPDAPVFLSIIGDLSVLDHPTIGIVGTRNMSRSGQQAVEHFVPAFVHAGITTVSGLALGVDAAVARKTVQSGGSTVAVLGNGLADIYPTENRGLAEEIIENGGLIMSELPLAFLPGKFTFPARNRIIAGLTPATLVIEAPKESGSIITADLAIDYNRDVFAVPGSIFDEGYAGCNHLIAAGHAHLAESANDVLKAMGIIHNSNSTLTLYEAQDPDQKIVYQSLSGMPQTIDDLAQRIAVEPARIAVALTMMELAGAVKNVGGGQWVRN